MTFFALCMIGTGLVAIDQSFEPTDEPRAGAEPPAVPTGIDFAEASLVNGSGIPGDPCRVEIPALALESPVGTSLMDGHAACTEILAQDSE